MEDQHLVEQFQQTNQTQDKKIKNQQSQDNEDQEEKVQIQKNYSHFQNLSSSSIQNVLSDKNNDFGQKNQVDELNLIMQEQKQKKNFETQKIEQNILNQQRHQKKEKLVKEVFKLDGIQVDQVQKDKNDNKEVKNYSQTNNNLGDKDIKQVSLNIVMKQIPIETFDEKNVNEQRSNNERIQKGSQQLEKFKSIIKSPKFGNSQIYSGDPYLNQSIQLEQQLQQKKHVQQYNQMIENNLNEIFQFYANSLINPIKLHTKYQIFEQKQLLNLKQFMQFCKDFKLIDLLVTNEFIQKYAGQKSQKPLYQIKYKNRVKDSFIITKQILQEIFKKCSGINQLSFSEFQYSLIKIADIIFPVSGSVKALYLYFGVHNPDIYSKKLIKVEDTNQSRVSDQATMNIKSEGRNIFPQIVNKPKVESQRIQDTFEISKQIKIQQKNGTQIQNNKFKANSLRWDDLGNCDYDFDPRRLLLEEDLIDQEDAFYLKEYMITRNGITKKQDFLKQYQEDQRVKYQQNLDYNLNYKKNKGYAEDIYKEFIPDIHQKWEHKKHTTSISKSYKLGEASLLIDSNQTENQSYYILQKQKQKEQLIHPNSFEERKNYNDIEQISFVNKSFINQNKSISNEGGYNNTSQFQHENKMGIQKQEKVEKKREQSILVGIKKSQENKINKIRKK
ncbi:unnamed protein product [Paramecium sonneborni]|uniref:Uncharacterized protein n=1 Tax=Paramecium sonneborni TaxID=65129 RepID=A0A8S1K976_9CILI|nr:unnamed protein product [Paramecium sonneborni]